MTIEQRGFARNRFLAPPKGAQQPAQRTKIRYDAQKRAFRHLFPRTLFPTRDENSRGFQPFDFYYGESSNSFDVLFTLLAVRGSSPPRSLRSVWGKYTRFCCVAERARRGRETAVFSLVRVFIALRDIVEVCPSRGMVRDLRARYACFFVFGHANFAVLVTQFRYVDSLGTLTLPLDLDL